MSRTLSFVSMQQVRTSSEDFNCWAFRTEDGKYHLGLIELDGSIGWLCNEPTPKEDIQFKIDGEIRLFSRPWNMEVYDDE